MSVTPLSSLTFGASLTCWVLFDAEKKGSETQCRGLAQGLIQDQDATTLDLITSFPMPKVGFLRWIPRRWWPLFLKEEKGILKNFSGKCAPSVVISSGTRASALAAFLKTCPSFQKTYFINILNPRLPLKSFDLVLAPHHDGMVAENVLSFVGGLHGLTDVFLKQEKKQFSALLKNLSHPRITLLLGGPSPSFKMKKSVFETLGQQVSHLYKAHKGSFLVSFSRRTPQNFKEAFLAETKHIPLKIYDPLVDMGPNPYGAFLATADYIVVTADSISMVTEACYTGKPVMVVGSDTPMPKKFKRFHEDLTQRQATKSFKGSLDHWEVVVVRETNRIVQRVKERLNR